MRHESDRNDANVDLNSSTDIAALGGRLAIRNTPPPDAKPGEIDINPIPGAQLAMPVNGVFIGRTGNGAFKDSSTTPVAEAGFGFKVWQNSTGGTGVEAVAMDGFSIDGAWIDDIGRISWKQKESYKDGVTVVSDRGKESRDLPREEWDQAGNPGMRWGVIRVTDEATDTDRFFALAADFDGQVDGWTVRGAYTEVERPQSQAVITGTTNPSLPTAPQ